MRIGIDATSWTNWRGFGRFTRAIVNALVEIDRENEYVLFFDSTYERCDGVPAKAKHVVARTEEGQSDAISVEGRRSTGDLMRMARAVASEHVDVLFYPSIDSYFPTTTRTARVVMIHDVIPETLPDVMLPSRASRWRRSLKVRAAIAQSRMLAAGSERVRRQIVSVFRVSPDGIGIIPYGVSTKFRPPTSIERVEQDVSERHGIHTPYLLHVGGFGPNKNIPALLEGFAALIAEADCRNTSLVFVGKREDDDVYDEARRIDDLLARSDVSPRVRLLGFQPDEELVRIYQAARGLILPSLVEGFGLPAIEAVSCGTPAVVTTESPLPETLGDAAICVDPRDGQALVLAMRRVLCEERLARNALDRTGQFGWETSARAAIHVFRSAAGNAKG